MAAQFPLGKPRFEEGPITFQVYQQVNAGQLVQPGTAGNAALVGVAAADSVTCLGVATRTALPAGSAYTGVDTLAGGGYPLIDASVMDENVAVANEGVFRLATSGTVAFGATVKCGAAGSVVAFVEGTDTPSKKIGRCVDPAGGTAGGSAVISIDVS
jgi:hypothetical protein